MCLAIAKPEGQTIPIEHLRNGFNRNPDGAGYAITRNMKNIIRKGFFTFDEFIADYNENVRDTQSAIVHFRLASHGPINKRNCHPWIVSPNVCMIHNGVLDCHSTPTLSDTGFFVARILAKHANRIADPVFHARMENRIGERNKFVFLYACGEIVIYNEASGHWNSGVWYSNDSYLTQTEKT